jgi:hypothetical protein
MPPTAGQLHKEPEAIFVIASKAGIHVTTLVRPYLADVRDFRFEASNTASTAAVW